MNELCFDDFALLRAWQFSILGQICHKPLNAVTREPRALVNDEKLNWRYGFRPRLAEALHRLSDAAKHVVQIPRIFHSQLFSKVAVEDLLARQSLANKQGQGLASALLVKFVTLNRVGNLCSQCHIVSRAKRDLPKAGCGHAVLVVRR